jgi:cell division septation protein DedD
MVSMDWIRRNWPDLLIGLALLLVIGGIIATLLNGGNFLPFGRGSQPATVSGASTTTTAPVTPESTAPVNTATNSSESVAAVDLNAPSATERVSVGDETGTIVAVLPGEAPDAATTAIDQAADATVPATQADPATAATVQDSTTQVTPASETPSAPYRISVGAFGSAENAERKAQSFKDAGYPVFVGRQGDLSLVLIGPYNSQGEAEQVKAQLQSSGLEANPIVYEFRPEGASAPAETAPATTEPATTEAVAATPSTTEATSSTTTATTALPTTGSGRYLQVGAYGDQTAAAPQRSLLEGLGFTVSSVEEGEFIKLLVGPYDDAALNEAQGRLSAQGIDSFVR